MKFRFRPFITITAAFILALIISGCPLPIQSSAENKAPYDLTTARPVDVYWSTDGQTSQLLVDGDIPDPLDDVLDPDIGDTVTFHYYSDDGSGIPAGWGLDENTGVISVAYIDWGFGVPAEVPLSFYTSDGQLSSQPVEITFKFGFAPGG